jgi:hypothetical protein
MDRAIDTTTAEQRRIRRVHDRIDILLRDVAAHEHDARRAEVWFRHEPQYPTATRLRQGSPLRRHASTFST